MFMKPSVHKALINKASAIVVQGFIDTKVATFAVPAAMPWSTAAAARWSAVGGFFVAVAASSTLSEELPMVSVILSRYDGLLFGSLPLDVQSGYLRAKRAQMALLWEVARGGSASVLQRLPRPRTSV